MEIKLNHNIEFILNLLKEEGQGYIVGGFVRDIFLGLNPKDCDFVTDIEYERLKEIFKNFKPKEMGKHFGIIQIKIGGTPYEIAKMREDIGIPLDRKVQKVEFTKNIYDDLKRRDFTINAIAYDGEKIYFGEKSKEDIENKILRFVGECTQRIKEDPLRILRYFRFLATKDLKYFPETIDEIKKSKNLIQNLSAERIRDEFSKIITGKNAYKVLKVMSENKILEEIIPEWSKTIGFDQKNIHHIYTIDEHILKSLEFTSRDLITRLAVLFHDIGKPRCYTFGEDGQGHFYKHEKYSIEIAEKLMLNLKFSKLDTERVCKIIRYHSLYRQSIDEIFVKKMLNRFGEEDLYRYLEVVEADRRTHNNDVCNLEDLEQIKNILKKIQETKPPLSIKDLKISGKDLLKVGVSKGKIIGEILDYLMEKVLEDENLNNYETLINLAINYKDRPET
ncbi:MAG: CCA tRNA nucleotidyltransferase [Fusobacterium sp.]|uniref:CCA tRNA nucleotidyltransferase n=1 Tax=Fusobacterium sp. TaxID=68766 RepID=UPI002A74B262|nr:CCA tRNA nucleotidyltransferase [Fusobacterium sp.]MDY2981195.1 CCA tRNA nucleotidyltransferase [Fusobacterium sp.]